MLGRFRGRDWPSLMLSFARASKAAIFAAPLLMLAGTASAQQRGLLDDFFGGNQAQPPAAARRAPDEADLTVRLERLENHVRQLTGTIEQLQFRNQQLEQQIQRLGGTVPSSPNVAATPPMPPRGAPTAAPLPNPPAVIPAEPRRRSDVFDPNENPNAPGAPRPLGSVIATADPNAVPAVGAPGGRVAGAPLDLGTPGGSNLEPLQQDASLLLPPPPRNPNATGAQTASIAPAATPRDEFDLAYGYVQRKDYALAEESLRGFLTKYPNDMRIPEAQFWLGESLFQRQRYRDAAESFLTVTTKHERTTKAPDALLRLGQSLAALGEKETACAAWGEIGRKYARASEQVKKTVAAEQKRVRC